FDYFTEAIVGKAKASRGDYTASEDDNVLVQGVEGNKYALGYIPYAYYAPHSNRMKAVAIEWEKNKVKGAILPSPENVLAGTYNPLSRPLFIYVSRKSMDKPAVKEFADFYLKNVATLAKEVKYLPLQETAYQMAMERLRNMQTGTGFGGVPEVGLPVEEILRRAPKA
ncbi:MAG: phosphate-binding protein, partial [Pyrinomonadaceae bacterium]